MSTRATTTLVTGVPGWLGSRFVEVLMRGFNGEGPSDTRGRIRALTLRGIDVSPLQAMSPEIERVEGDLCDLQSLSKAVQGVETIFHLAGVVHAKNTQGFLDLNTYGTRNLLEAAERAGVRRLIHISSNSVGGHTREPRLMRETDPPRPYRQYGRSKFLAEQAVREVAQRGKLETVILRPCWYYGPYQAARQTRFFRMIKAGNPIIFGDGTNLRSMSYLDNVIEAMLLAAQKPQASGRTYWIADAKPYPTFEIYETIADLLEVKNFRPRRLPGLTSELCRLADWGLQKLGCYQQELHVAGEMNKNIACSIETAREDLGYCPRIELREGMQRSLDWCRQAGIKI